jgi:hypothetical protein
MPFHSRRLRMQLRCHEATIQCAELTIHRCPGHSCFRFGTVCPFDSCDPGSPIVGCPEGVSNCGPSPFVHTPETPWVRTRDQIVFERDPENPDAVLLRPEHLPRLRGQLQVELAQIDEMTMRKGEIEGQLEELESAEKELKKRSGER